MSRYGAPGGPRHGDYEPPADPWGRPGEGSWGGAADWGTPEAGYGPPYPAGPGYAPPVPPNPPQWRGEPPHFPAGAQPPPAPPAPPRRGGALVALLVMLLILVAAGVATTLFLVSGDGTPVAGPSPEPGGTAGGPGAGGTPGPDPTTDNLGLAAGFARVGDCLVNDGSDDAPQMRVTACDAEEDALIYQVLARFDQSVSDDEGARVVCAGTEGYQVHYYFISEAEGESFVLCLSEGE